MSTEYQIEVPSCKSIYDNNANNSGSRKIRVDFSVPDTGIDSNTGILLLIAGFGGNNDSKVYTKMRNQFADKYNLVTIQCSYFGHEFMGYVNKVNVSDSLYTVFSEQEISQICKNGYMNYDIFLQIAKNYDTVFIFNADLSQESPGNFNEMGIMQAIDNITAVLSVINILMDNDKYVNTQKIITYGYSHGAYLAYLCNALAPKLFSLIVDNSAWLTPDYLFRDRDVYWTEGNIKLKTLYRYLAKDLITDTEILNLPLLYKQFTNNCNIISFHGVTDELVNYQDKLSFCKNIENCNCTIIHPNQVDNEIFKSTTHGLGADFIKLFNYVMDKFEPVFKKDSYIELQEEVIYTSRLQRYFIDYKNVLPRIEVKPVNGN